MKRIVVLGCGPTALGLAYRLFRLQSDENAPPFDDVELLILEKEDVPGGLARSIKDPAGFTWDLGGHVTYSHYDFFDEALDWAVPDWNYITRNAKLDMSYLFGETTLRLLPYPAQFAIPYFPEKEKEACIKELKVCQSTEYITKPTTFDEWILQNFGPTLAEVFFRQYNKKVWTTYPREMNAVWVGDRVAKMDIGKLEELCALDRDQLEKVDFGWGPNAKFRFPLHGGTGGCWTGLHAKLPQHWFRFKHTVTAVDADAKTVSCVDAASGREERFDYDALISTVPLDQLSKLSTISPTVAVRHNKVIIIGVGLRLPVADWLADKTWLYWPGDDVPFYRCTVLSNYSRHVTPDADAYWSVMCEAARPPDEPVDEAALAEQTVATMQRKGFFVSRDQVVSVHTILLPYGYPIPTVERDPEVLRLRELMESKHMYSRGRFGNWKYEVANQDHCFMQGRQVLDRILFGTPETVLDSDGSGK